MAKDRIEIDIIAKGVKTAQTDVKKLQKNTEDLSKKSGSALDRLKKNWLGIAAATAGVVAVGRKVLNAYAEQEKAERTLAAAMKQAGTFTKAAFKENLKYASSLQKITTFGDEAILGVQKMLTNFGIEGEAMKGLTKATLDLAAAKGMDLKAAADLVAKSVGSSTNALTRYGIEVKGAAGSTERAQQAVENITKLFGGAAAAEADTYSGKIQQMKNEVGDIFEEIGGKLAPVIINLVKGFSKLPGPMKKVTVAIVLLIPVIAALNLAFGPIGLILAGVATAALAASIAIGKLNDKTKRMESIRKRNEELKKSMDLKNKEIQEEQKLLDIINRRIKKTEDRLKKEREILETTKKGTAANTEALVAESSFITHINALKTKAEASEIRISKVVRKRGLAEKEISKNNEEAAKIRLKTNALDIEAQQKLLLSKVKTAEVTKESNEKEINDTKKIIDLKKQAADGAIELAQSTFDTIFRLEAEARARDLVNANEHTQALKAMDEEEKAAKIQSIKDELEEAKKAGDTELQNQLENQLKRSELEERAAEKEKELKRKSFQSEKDASIGQALINGALAITKTFAQFGWPAGIIPAAVQAGLTGIQVGAINSQPVPAFAGGTSFAPGGISLVGEQGPELVNLPRGSQVIPNKEINHYDNKKVNIQVMANDPIDLVNRLKQEYGLEIFT